METENAKNLGIVAICCVLVVLFMISGKSPKSQDHRAEAIKISPEELVKEYEENEIAADNKYKGMYLTLSGKIDSLGKDILDDIFIVLAADRFRFTFRNVQCFFPDKASTQLARLSKGQTVTVTGKCRGLMGNVIINDCVLH